MAMTRRQMMGWMAAAGGAAAASRWIDAADVAGSPATAAAAVPAASPASQPATQPAMTRWQQSAAQKRELTKDITWLTHEPIQFLIRRGDHDDDLAEQYRRMVEPDNIKRMADAGIRYGRIFFYKGFGLAYERSNIETARRVADLMHRLGMKVSLYVGGTMFIETFYRETPEAVDWEQRDQNNRWISYGSQTFRHYACPNEVAYRQYIKRVLTIGVQDLHADQFAMDNIMLQAEPESCRCRRCKGAFAEFLRKRYPTPDAVRDRFGLPDVEAIQVNEWATPSQPDGMTAIDDPVLQEWTRFRCETLADYCGDLYNHVKQLNPATEMMLNIKGVYSFNRYWTNAVYHPLYAGRADALSFDTGGYNEHIDASTGALISQIRSYKVARGLKMSCEDSLADDVRAAVHMAFGYQNPASQFVGTPFGSGAQAEFTPLLEFFRQYNDRYYVGTELVADIAVLHNWPSMAYSLNATYVPVTLLEQVLMQYKLPFDLLFDEQLDRAQRYQMLVLAGQECVGDGQAARLLEYVRQGGTLLVTGNTAEFNDRRERRTGPNPLLPARQMGRGRIVYLDQIVRADKAPPRGAVDVDPEPGATPQQTTRMTPAHWILPRNHAQIYQTIVQNLPQGPAVRCDGPLTTVMEVLTRPQTHETIVHLINFEKHSSVPKMNVSVRKQWPGAVRSVQAFSADVDDPVNVPFTQSGTACNFAVRDLRRYTMMVIGQ